MTILRNARKYLKQDGQILLSVDLYWKTNSTHPVKFNRTKIENMVREAGFGENARHLRFMTGQLALITPYKIVRDLVVRADRKFRKIFKK